MYYEFVKVMLKINPHKVQVFISVWNFFILSVLILIWGGGVFKTSNVHLGIKKLTWL